MSDLVHVCARSHVFADTKHLEMPAGLTVAEIVEDALATEGLRPYAVVTIDGSLCDEALWSKVRPRPGHKVTIIPVPRGSSGGGQKNTLAIVLAIVVSVVAIAAGQVYGPALAGTLGVTSKAGIAAVSAGLTAVIGSVGMLAVNAIAPPPSPKGPRLGQDAPGTAITGFQNELRPFGVVPRVLGRHRVFPRFAAPSYTELVGDHQYIRALFTAGPGPLKMTQFKIGDDPIENFKNVELEVIPGEPGVVAAPTLFPNSVFEETLGGGAGVLLNPGAWEMRTTQALTDEIGVGFICPLGLRRGTRDGGVDVNSVQVEVQYRKVGDTEWIQAGELDATTEELITEEDVEAAGTAGVESNAGRKLTSRNVIDDPVFDDPGVKKERHFVDTPNAGMTAPGIFTKTAASRTPVRFGGTWAVIPGQQYEVRCRRITPITDEHSRVDRVHWLTLQSVRHGNPVTEPGESLVAVRIRSSDQLNGILNTFNFIAESILPDWDDATQQWVMRPTNNPASCYREVLQGSSNPFPAEDDEVDLPGLIAFHDWCRIQGWTYNRVIDDEVSVIELLNEIAAAGRAARAMGTGLKWGVVIDEEQVVTRAGFTPRTSWGLTVEKAFLDLPHAFRIPFQDEANGYQVGERLVFADGFDKDNATHYETMDAPGKTNGDEIWRLYRYHHAVLKHRSSVYSFWTDVAHLVVGRGSLFPFQHDVPLFGIHSARIKALVTSGDDTIGVVLDDLVEMEAPKSYSIRVVRSDASAQFHTIVTQAGATDTLAFTGSVPTDEGPQVGDLVMFGEAGLESVNLIVRAIERGPDLTAKLICVKHAPEVYLADQGPIPPPDPGTTVPPQLRTPPAPLIDGLVSEGSTITNASGGSVGTRLTVHWVLPTLDWLEGSVVRLWYRPSGVPDDIRWTPAGDFQADSHVGAIEPLVPGNTYDVRLQTVSRQGIGGPRVTIGNIELPQPPVYTSYVLTPVAGGYLATIGEQQLPPRPPKVTGLRLVNSVSGHPNDTQFAGRVPKWTWNAVALWQGIGDAEDDLTQDNEIRGYYLEIHTDGVLRHKEERTAPGYEYGWEQNLEDHAGAPARTITIKVWARSHDGQLSAEPQTQTVTNPASDMGQILPVLVPTFSGLNISFSAFASTDHDLESFDVLIGTSSPPSQLAATLAPQQREYFASGLDPGTAYFVQILPRDAFGPGVPSQIATATPLAVNAIDVFTRTFVPKDIVFSFNPLTNVLSWTAGELAYTIDGASFQTRSIAAGNAQWVSGALLVYYILGDTQLRTTTSLVDLIGTDRNLMAVYTGGTGLAVNWGKILQHGADMVAGTIGAAQLVAGAAVITQSIQIANAIIQNSHIVSLAVDKLTAGNIRAQWVVAEGSLIAGNPSGGHVLLNNDGVFVRNNDGDTVAALQKTAPFIRIGKLDGTQLELDGAGSLKKIVSNQIAAEAVTKSTVDEGAVAAPTSEVTIVSRVFTASGIEGSKIISLVFAQVDEDVSSGMGSEVQLKRNGAGIVLRVVSFERTRSIVMAREFTELSGNQTFSVTARPEASKIGCAVRATMFLLEAKR